MSERGHTSQDQFFGFDEQSPRQHVIGGEGRCLINRLQQVEVIVVIDSVSE